jgi:hypothetical protein
MRHLILTVAVVLVCIACVGCAVRSTQKYDAYRNVVDKWSYPTYVWVTTKDLVLDLTDIVSWEMVFGPSLLVDVQPTKVLEVGGGYADVGKHGWRNRFMGWWREKRTEGGASMLYYRSMDFEPVFGTVRMWEFPPTIRDFAIRNNVDRHWLDVGAQVNILWGGFGLYVSPSQTVDLLANLVEYPYNILLRRPLYLFGLRPPEFDFMNDDTPAQARKDVSLKLIDPGKGMLAAEVIDETFRVPY